MLKSVNCIAPPACDDLSQFGVLIAYQQALHTLLLTQSIEEGVRSIANRGGNANTNAAIYGLLAGALEGRAAISRRWIEALQPNKCLRDLIGTASNDLGRLAEILAKKLLTWK